MLHEPAAKIGVDHASEKKTRLGLILFLVYAVVYAIFVLIGLLYTDLLGVKVIFGVNLAIIYGIGLIVLAGVMGFIYNIVCTRMEDKMNGGTEI